MSGACAEKASRPSAAVAARWTSKPSRRSASARGSAIGRSSSITRTFFLLTMATLTIRTQLPVGFPPGRPPRALESNR